jgi:hypothetical protein
MFDEIYDRLNDIVNSSFNLREKIFDNKVVKKTLKSLPNRFKPKATSIDESKDIDTINIEELVGSLQTYELSLPQPKKKILALRSSKKKVVGSSNDNSSDEEAATLLAKKFSGFLKFNKGFSKSPKLDVAKGDSQGSTQGKRDNPKKDKNTCGVQCFEYSGFGHIRADCPNF